MFTEKSVKQTPYLSKMMEGTPGKNAYEGFTFDGKYFFAIWLRNNFFF